MAGCVLLRIRRAAAPRASSQDRSRLTPIMPTLGLYIQFPFCASKCSFCNFSSQVAPARVLDVYCQALEREIECLPQIYEAEDSELSGGADAGLAAVLALPVDTIYLGGGTPSL